MNVTLVIPKEFAEDKQIKIKSDYRYILLFQCAKVKFGNFF